jgi:hypothetical protein
VNAAFHFRVFRDTRQIKDTMAGDCGNQLRNTPESYVKSNCFCEKYIKGDDGTMTNVCPAN